MAAALEIMVVTIVILFVTIVIDTFIIITFTFYASMCKDFSSLHPHSLCFPLGMISDGGCVASSELTAVISGGSTSQEDLVGLLGQRGFCCSRMKEIVKSCERSEFLTLLVSNRLVSHSVRDAGNHDTPGSETKVSLLLRTVAGARISVLAPDPLRPSSY